METYNGKLPKPDPRKVAGQKPPTPAGAALPVAGDQFDTLFNKAMSRSKPVQEILDI